MNRLWFLIPLLIVAGCSSVGEISRDVRAARGDRAAQVERIVDGAGDILRESGRTIEDAGYATESIRRGRRRTVGAITDGVLYVPVDNWHNKTCRIRVFSRGAVISQILVAPGDWNQVRIPEDFVEGRSDVTVNSACGAYLTSQRIEFDFRNGWFEVDGGRNEHRTIVLDPGNPEDRFSFYSATRDSSPTPGRLTRPFRVRSMETGKECALPPICAEKNIRCTCSGD